MAKRLIVFIAIPAFIVLGTLIAIFFLSPTSVISKALAPQPTILQSEGRTNIIMLGIDKRNPGEIQSGILTDTIMVASVPQNSGNIVIVSLPRDLWIENKRSKVNEIYGMLGATETALGELKKEVSGALGIPIHYQVLVGFNGFKEAIDALGGITVEVQNDFTDYRYPIQGREVDTCGVDIDALKEEKGEDYILTENDFPCRFETLTFKKGLQEMNGATALKYARSRHSSNPAEGNDFARSKRQQQVLIAIRNKALSAGTILNPTKIAELYDIYKKYFSTDIFLSDAQALFLLANKAGLGEIKAVVLTNGKEEDGAGSGLLYTPEDKTPFGGKWVLLPVGKTYNRIHALISETLYGNKKN